MIDRETNTRIRELRDRVSELEKAVAELQGIVAAIRPPTATPEAIREVEHGEQCTCARCWP